MAATKPRANHQARINWWREQFRRHRQTSLSVTEFCLRLGVSVTTFYYWKKRVGEALPDASVPVPGARLSHHATPAATFIPLSIIEPGPGAELEIELANACMIRLKGAVDPILLQAAITAAGQLNGSRQGAN